MRIGICMPYGFSQQGRREGQQDCMYPETLSETTPFFVVCDGVGGRRNGEIASGLVCEAFSRVLNGQFCQGDEMTKSLFENTLLYAYNMLYDNRSAGLDMATTLAFLAISSEGIFIAHLGDTRVYQFRRGEGIVFITEDHSLVRSMVNEKRITEEEALTYNKRNMITRCMRVVTYDEEYDQATIDIIRNVREGDVFLVCTDGVYGEIKETELVKLLLENECLEAKAQKLANITRYGNDNNTAFLIEVKRVENDGGCDGRNVSYETGLRQERLRSGSYDVISNIGNFLRRIFS